MAPSPPPYRPRTRARAPPPHVGASPSLPPPPPPPTHPLPALSSKSGFQSRWCPGFPPPPFSLPHVWPPPHAPSDCSPFKRGRAPGATRGGAAAVAALCPRHGTCPGGRRRKLDSGAAALPGERRHCGPAVGSPLHPALCGLLKNLDTLAPLAVWSQLYMDIIYAPAYFISNHTTPSSPLWLCGCSYNAQGSVQFKTFSLLLPLTRTLQLTR
ncbi:formin-like protein 5 [Zalophus californianus]|uniref:Formin-like protein 5 n=1 Tax=Zalophus californianus TaxID=9704 RepID=A0A6J2DSI4_ZALCA|nr:formin-like protein 5 [Zalophus californianus]